MHAVVILFSQAFLFSGLMAITTTCSSSSGIEILKHFNLIFICTQVAPSLIAQLVKALPQCHKAMGSIFVQAFVEIA